MHQAGGGQRHSQGLSRQQGVLDVLDMQVHLESGFELALHEGRDLHVQGPAAGHAAANGLIHQLDVDTGFLGQDHGFGDSLEHTGDNDLIGKLGETSGPNLAHAHHALAHAFQNGLDP